MIGAVLAVVLVLAAAYAAHIGTVPAFLWLLLISTAVAVLIVSILNLYARWDRQVLAAKDEPIASPKGMTDRSHSVNPAESCVLAEKNSLLVSAAEPVR